MSIAAKCICGKALNGYCQENIKECRMLIRPTVWPVELFQKESFDVIYELSTLLDFAGEAKENNITISTELASKIIKILNKNHDNRS